MDVILARIVAPKFIAGIVLEDDVVVLAPPLLRYMIGWKRDKVRAHVKKKGWQIKKVRTS